MAFPMKHQDSKSDYPCGMRYIIAFGNMMSEDKIKEKFIKSLWHNASEEPEVGKRILIEHTVFGYVNGYKSLMWNGKVDWNKFLENDFEYDANKWLYIDDILPKEGGEE